MKPVKANFAIISAVDYRMNEFTEYAEHQRLVKLAAPAAQHGASRRNLLSLLTPIVAFARRIQQARHAAPAVAKLHVSQSFIPR